MKRRTWQRCVTDIESISYKSDLGKYGNKKGVETYKEKTGYKKEKMPLERRAR